MYGFIWRHLPGPAWLKAIESLILIAGVVYVLMQYVFPWANATWHLSGNAAALTHEPEEQMLCSDITIMQFLCRAVCVFQCFLSCEPVVTIAIC